MPALLALIFCSNVPELTVDYRCSIIELSHVCSVTDHDDGTRSVAIHLSQLIFWQLASDGEFYVRDWRYLKDAQRPRYDHASGTWQVSWLDRTWQLVRVTAPSFLETYSIADPEVENRKLLPVNQRRVFKR